MLLVSEVWFLSVLFVCRSCVNNGIVSYSIFVFRICVLLNLGLQIELD